MKKLLFLFLLIPAVAYAWGVLPLGGGVVVESGGAWESGNALALVVYPDTDNADFKRIQAYNEEQTNYEPSIQITYASSFNADATDDSSYKATCVLTGAIDLGNDGTSDGIGIFRFDNVTIPSGATISAATFKFHRADAYNGTINLKIAGIKELDTIALATDDCGDDRDRTTATVDWDISSDPGWGVETTSPSIVTIIQEIIDQ